MTKRIYAILLLAVSLTACRTEEVERVVESRRATVAEMQQAATRPGGAVSHDPLRVTRDVWAGASAVRLSRGQPLPARFEGPRGFALVAADSLTLANIVAQITAQTGIPVRVEQASGGGDDAGATVAASDMPVAYEGPLSGFLERMTSHFGLSWRYDGSSLSISRFETRIFVVEALPGKTTISEGLEDEDSSGGSESGSEQTGGLKQSARLSIDLEYWSEIKTTLESLLGGVGSVTTAPSGGTVTVSTTPEIMRTVARYIADENRRMTAQIAVNVAIYAVTVTDTEEMGTDFSAVFNRIGNAINFTAAGADFSFNQTGVGGLGVAVLSDIGPVDSGAVLMEALSSLGNTTRVAQFPMTTLNNRPVTRRVGRDRAYLESVAISQSETFQSTTLTPGTVREGFSMQLTPRILADGRILMQYSMSLIDIVQIREFGTDDQQIQLPETSTRVFVQQSLLRSGNTLVLGGFSQDDTNQVLRGVGTYYNWLMGGGVRNDQTQTMLFVAITPQVIDIPRAEGR